MRHAEARFTDFRKDEDERLFQLGASARSTLDVARSTRRKSISKGIDMQHLPSNFAELQDLAKRLEEDAGAVRSEARDKLDARREKIRTNLAERMDRLGSNLEKAQSQTSGDWVALRNKVQADREQFKQRLGERREAYSAFFADSTRKIENSAQRSLSIMQSPLSSRRGWRCWTPCRTAPKLQHRLTLPRSNFPHLAGNARAFPAE